MKCLLVYPEFPNRSFWYFNHALRFIGKKSSLPPLGLLTVASLLPKAWQLSLVDMNVEPLTDEAIRDADLVVISAMSIQRDSVDGIVHRCIEHGTTMVAGGPLFTAYPEEFSDIDHLVLNEAEITLPRFLCDFASGTAERIYTSDQWADMGGSPVPLWELIELKHYASMCVQYSRGCPYNCDFCDITVLFGGCQRAKPTDTVLAELDALYHRGWRGNVFFVDDNLIGNHRRLKDDLLPALAKWMRDHRYPFRFQTQASIDLAEDDRLLDMIVDAGFEAVFVGIETPDVTSLKHCGKTQNTKGDLLKQVRKLQNAGLQVQGGFILGFDSDRESIFDRMGHFINESGIVTSMVGLLNAPKGSKLYKRMKEESRLLFDPTGDNTDLTMNFKPKMDFDKLKTGYRKVIGDIYRPDAYYARLKVFLKHYRCSTRNEFARRFSRENIRAVFMSVFLLGIKPGIRRHFWGIMAWTLFHRPKSIPITFNLCIYSYQYLKHYNIQV